MTEKEVSQGYNENRLRHPPSVPFLWEEKPGIFKKDWKPPVPALPPPPPPVPVKLIASIPFTWEEKPGKPRPILPASGSDGDDEIFESDLEAFGFETDDSSSSAPSLLANQLMSALAISTAVPVRETPLTENSDGQPETFPSFPSSPSTETSSSASSYATGTASLVGTAFLESLFPLLPPNSGFLEKVGCPESSSRPPERQNREFNRESNSSGVVRKAPTLGELIMMSRRRSCRLKTVQRRKQNLWVDFTKKKKKKKGFGCHFFGTGSKRIGGLLLMRKQPRFKLK